MQFMLNSLHATNIPITDTSNESPDRNCDCIIHKTFCGKLASTVTCDDCKNKTITIEPFMDLSLDLRIAVQKKRKFNGSAKEKEGKEEEGEMKLAECLRRFTFVEKLAREEYTCRKCERQRDATKQLSIKRLPPVLSIHLKVRMFHSQVESTMSKLTITTTALFDHQIRLRIVKAGDTRPLPHLTRYGPLHHDADVGVLAAQLPARKARGKLHPLSRDCAQGRDELWPLRLVRAGGARVVPVRR
jgi:ubiquitin C-terminal hydrolase